MRRTGGVRDSHLRSRREDPRRPAESLAYRRLFGEQGVQGATARPKIRSPTLCPPHDGLLEQGTGQPADHTNDPRKSRRGRARALSSR